MSLWQNIVDYVAQNIEIWLSVCLTLQVVWAIAVVSLWGRYRALNGRLKQLTAGATGASLERILFDHLARVEEVDTRQRAMEQRVSDLEVTLPHCLQRVGLVRYDAFEDVGGQQSFSLAILDSKQTGIVLTSVYTRTDVRVYAKAIREGQPSHPLSEEEQQALRVAQSTV